MNELLDRARAILQRHDPRLQLLKRRDHEAEDVRHASITVRDWLIQQSSTYGQPVTHVIGNRSHDLAPSSVDGRSSVGAPRSSGSASTTEGNTSGATA